MSALLHNSTNAQCSGTGVRRFGAAMMIRWRQALLAALLLVAPTFISTIAEAAAPAAPGSIAAPAQPIAWTALTPDEKGLLERVRPTWDELPAAAQHRLRVAAQRWPKLSDEQRDRLEQRLARWNAMTPGQRAQVRARYAEFETLPPDQRRRLRAAFRRYGGLPEAEREQLRNRFEQMTPSQRREFLDAAQAQDRAARVRAFFESIPPAQRGPTRDMLRALSFEQRRAFRQHWRRLPPDQRDAWRQSLIAMSPQQRGAELARPAPDSDPSGN